MTNNKTSVSKIIAIILMIVVQLSILLYIWDIIVTKYQFTSPLLDPTIWAQIAKPYIAMLIFSIIPDIAVIITLKISKYIWSIILAVFTIVGQAVVFQIFKPL